MSKMQLPDGRRVVVAILEPIGIGQPPMIHVDDGIAPLEVVALLADVQASILRQLQKFAEDKGPPSVIVPPFPPPSNNGAVPR